MKSSTEKLLHMVEGAGNALKGKYKNVDIDFPIGKQP